MAREKAVPLLLLRCTTCRYADFTWSRDLVICRRASKAAAVPKIPHSSSAGRSGAQPPLPLLLRSCSSLKSSSSNQAALITVEKFCAISRVPGPNGVFRPPIRGPRMEDRLHAQVRERPRVALAVSLPAGKHPQQHAWRMQRDAVGGEGRCAGLVLRAEAADAARERRPGGGAALRAGPAAECE